MKFYGNHAGNSLRCLIILIFVGGATGISLAQSQPDSQSQPQVKRTKVQSDIEATYRLLEQLKQEEEARRRKIQFLEQRLRRIETGSGVRRPAPASQILQDHQTPAPAPSAQSTSVRAAAGQVGSEKKIQQEEATKRSKSAQSVYQEQQGVLFDTKYSMEVGLTYSRYDRKELVLNGFLPLPSVILFGDITVDNVESDILTLNVLGRVGFTPRFQMDVNVPFLYRLSTYQSSAGTVNEEAEITMNPDVQLGDVSLGMYYQLHQEDQDWPDTVWNVRLRTPTGTEPYGIKNFQPTPNLDIPSEIASGSGVWGLSTGLSFIKTVDPVILFWNFELGYNFEEHFDDISSLAGETKPGDIKLGNSFQYGFGTAFAFNEKTSLSISFTHRLVEKSKTRETGSDWTTVVGSDANIATMNLGLTYARSNKSSVVVNIGTGLTPDAPDFQVGIKFPYSF